MQARRVPRFIQRFPNSKAVCVGTPPRAAFRLSAERCGGVRAANGAAAPCSRRQSRRERPCGRSPHGLFMRRAKRGADGSAHPREAAGDKSRRNEICAILTKAAFKMCKISTTKIPINLRKKVVFRAEMLYNKSCTLRVSCIFMRFVRF